MRADSTDPALLSRRRKSAAERSYLAHKGQLPLCCRPMYSQICAAISLRTYSASDQMAPRYQGQWYYPSLPHKPNNRDSARSARSRPDNRIRNCVLGAFPGQAEQSWFGHHMRSSQSDNMPAQRPADLVEIFWSTMMNGSKRPLAGRMDAGSMSLAPGERPNTRVRRADVVGVTVSAPAVRWRFHCLSHDVFDPRHAHRRILGGVIIIT